MIQFARGPFHVEILANENDALAVDARDFFHSVGFAFARGLKAAQLLFQWSIDEHMKRVVAIPQKEWRSPSDDHRVPFRRGAIDHPLHEAHHAVGVEMIQAIDGDALLKAAAHEDFHEAVKQGIAAFVEALDRRLIDSCEARDFASQLGIPELPAEAIRQFARDGAAARSVFALDGDGADHDGTPGSFYARAVAGCWF